MEKRTSHSSVALAVFCMLACVYMLTFNGLSHTDDEQLYITLTESMATGKGYSALPLLGNDRLQGNTGSVEPLHSATGIPLYLLAQTLQIGKAQILFILPAIYTSLTGALLTLIARKRGFCRTTSFVIGIAYGLGSIAFPYARMNFREPIAALALTFSVLCFEYSKNDNLPLWKRVCAILSIFISLGAATLAKITSAVATSLIFTAFILQKNLWKKRRRKETALLFSTIAITLIIVITASLLILPDESLSRFTLRFADYIRYTLPRLPHDHFWKAAAGMLISPGKGLFIYSPIIVFALFRPSITYKPNWLISYGATIALLCTQALIYNEEWWGITWGTRALLPVLPLLMLAALPTFDNFVKSNKKTKKILLFIVLLISILMQSGRLAANDPAYVAWVTNFTGKAVDAAVQWDLSAAPFFRYWWLGIRNPVSDIAWLHTFDINFLTTLIFVICVSVCLFCVTYILLNKKHHKWAQIIAIIACLAVIIFTPILALSDMRYYSNFTIFPQSRQILCDQTDENDLILIDFYLDPFWWYYSNFGCQDAYWAGLPYVHSTAIQGNFFYPRLAETEKLIRTWLQTGDVYLVTASQVDVIAYRSELERNGFRFKLLSQPDIMPIEIFQIQ